MTAHPLPLTPDDPRHGTYAGVVAHRKEGSKVCEPCKRARTKYAKQTRLNRLEGKPGHVSAAAVRRHLERLRAAGYSADEIPRLSGVSLGTVHRLLGDPDARVTRRVARQILAVPLPFPDEPVHVPKRGYTDHGWIVARRLRALVAIGYTFQDLEDETGVARWRLRELANEGDGRVRCTTYWAVVDTYSRLSMHPRDNAEARRTARERGWFPPFAWDDIDDPAERPQKSALWRGKL